MKEDFKEVLEIESDVTVSIENKIIKFKGPEGENEKLFDNPQIKFKIDDKTITLLVSKGTKREKKMIKTYCAHIKNLIKGVKQKFNYKLKICSSHFPMNVTLTGDKLIIKNFLGEKAPRTLKIKPGAEVKITGDIIDVTSCNKEKAGVVASDIELLTKKTGKDLRIFQDGIYITEKGGKKV